MSPRNPAAVRLGRGGLCARLLGGAALVVGLAGCDLPRDPGSTTESVRGNVLRAGLTEDAPWVVRGEDGEPAGIEVELVEEFAAAHDARVVWFWGSGDEALRQLEHRQLDLVAGGLTDDTPWAGRVGLSRVYFTEPPRPDLEEPREHVMAVPPGENGWLVALDRHLTRAAAAREDAWRERLLAEAGPGPLEPAAARTPAATEEPAGPDSEASR
ncbi:substrate-binding periplasmic protein [Alienimonas californiensis]|uniref:Bacterial extracellular solute-binding protein, family 3 n=1 Tax=Alienimonas californiensis TaxID=2527989 RepID=A0A517P6F2_9PLAN|nr:transporter substrate-binding domain-containing protein [Alienimonas californiensis]QDT14913.1 Bacterial extracellular solute-binding protein, family 3 [Alienimonas californiensis]